MGLSLVFCLVLVAQLTYGAPSKINEGPKVKTSYGWVQGKFTTTRGGRKIVEFLGIKYAKEPTGALRFKDPESPVPWKDVKQATQQCDACMQNNVMMEALRDKVSGSEDCLCVNVFTPQVSPPAKFPVIVFIHGGAFMASSSDRASYGPELLLDKDVVLVTLNYRLGVLGFLSTEDDVIPGNWGMKDQTAALRWVRDNIAQFGGDPHLVTLMGESAGANSVHLHMLSPLSKGLFHKAIAHSGSALSPFALARPGQLKTRAAVLAKDVGCPSTPTSAFLYCLQKAPAKKIVATTKNFLIWDVDPMTIWFPTVEPHGVKGAFLTENPRKLTSNLPFLTGFNYAEGGAKTLSLTLGDVEGKFRQWNKDFKTLTAMSLSLPPSDVDKIRKFYFGSVKEITPQMAPQITQLYDDFMIFNFLMDGVELHKGTKFVYYFNYNNSAHFSLLSKEMGNPLYLGVVHFDELPYVFPMLDSYKSMDQSLSLKIVEMWTNFAKHSTPTAAGVTWKPVSSPAIEYLEITNGHIGMRSKPFEKRREFYKSLKLHK